MKAHKTWQARAMQPASGDALELSEFQLYDGATRIDTLATLTASAAPTGALSGLKDNSTATGCYWASGARDVVLTWEFPTARSVTHIVLGARTVAARFPIALVLVGSDLGGDDVLRMGSVLGYCGLVFVSANKTPARAPNSTANPSRAQKASTHNYCIQQHFAGRVPYVVEREVLPRTNPPTYVPQWAKVRLEREIDGLVVAEQWSNPVTGAGVFEHFDEHITYKLTAIYPDSGMRAVIADRIKPEGCPEPTP